MRSLVTIFALLFCFSALAFKPLVISPTLDEELNQKVVSTTTEQSRDVASEGESEPGESEPGEDEKTDNPGYHYWFDKY